MNGVVIHLTIVVLDAETRHQIEPGVALEALAVNGVHLTALGVVGQTRREYRIEHQWIQTVQTAFLVRGHRDAARNGSVTVVVTEIQDIARVALDAFLKREGVFGTVVNWSDTGSLTGNHVRGTGDVPGNTDVVAQNELVRADSTSGGERVVGETIGDQDITASVDGIKGKSVSTGLTGEPIFHQETVSEHRGTLPTRAKGISRTTGLTNRRGVVLKHIAVLVVSHTYIVCNVIGEVGLALLTDNSVVKG